MYLRQRFWPVFVLTLSDGDLILAISPSAGPNLDPLDWDFFEWDPPDSADYPTLGIGEDFIFVTYSLAGNPVGDAAIGYADKSDLLTGVQPTPSAFSVQPIDGCINGPGRQIGVFQLYDDISPLAYFMTDLRIDGDESNLIRLYAVNTDTDTLTHFDLEVDPYYPPPLHLDLPGNAQVTSLWDCKFPVYRNGSGWAAFPVGKINEPDTAKVRWMEIDMNGWPTSQVDPAVVQQGEIDPGMNISVFYPAIHVDDDGNVAIAYNRCSAQEDISIRRKIRKHDDTAGTLRAALVLKQSESSPSGSAPWSDYTQMVEDPDDPGVMWSHLEWFEGTSTRKTWIGRTDLNHSLTLELVSVNDPPGLGDDVELTTLGAEPITTVKSYYSFDGCGSTYIPGLDVTLDIANAVFMAQKTTDPKGTAVKTFAIPTNFPTGDLWIQGAEYQNSSAVVATQVVQ